MLTKKPLDSAFLCHNCIVRDLLYQLSRKVSLLIHLYEQPAIYSQVVPSRERSPHLKYKSQSMGSISPGPVLVCEESHQNQVTQNLGSDCHLGAPVLLIKSEEVPAYKVC